MDRTQLDKHKDLRKDTDLRQLIDKVSPLPIDVVIEGETGVGKDYLARTIHRISRRQGSFVAVNCAALPETLAESELFGVTAGAYTGAQHSRAGYIETANEGTLYLDEIDSMPISLQAKLLRVVESRGVERLGSTAFVPVNVRIIVSTKTPLAELVEKKLFRQDLHFRLSTITIQLPTLRSRPESIAHMFRQFVEDASEQLQRKVPAYTPELYQQLLSHSWPGNIRELKGAASRFVLGISLIPYLSAKNLSATNRVSNADKRSLRHSMHELERILITEVMQHHNGRLDEVASELDIPKRTLYHRMKQLGIPSK
ncbi:sigma 54-interacting transcriptional regulator [Motiliproteus sp. MSK22-1]|uniref:sigma 54-interacting transcriptional regulator n=1 Tax=Motiliproteus sp. MSK22-1 TaxID=1897630 RepID=UPI0009F84299|nr:sigma-54 dependent transcriptional regulator [Motiliproteus sp. MSK22-1]